jgi:hypothetical protein
VRTTRTVCDGCDSILEEQPRDTQRDWVLVTVNAKSRSESNLGTDLIDLCPACQVPIVNMIRSRATAGNLFLGELEKRRKE